MQEVASDLQRFLQEQERNRRIQAKQKEEANLGKLLRFHGYLAFFVGFFFTDFSYKTYYRTVAYSLGGGGVYLEKEEKIGINVTYFLISGNCYNVNLLIGNLFKGLNL